MTARRAALALLVFGVQANAQEVVSPAALQQEETLLFEVTLDRGTLTDALQGYTMRSGLLLPFGELARLLDVNIDVDPRASRIVGRIGNAQRPLLVDLATGTARIDGRPVEFDPAEAVVGATDIFLSTKLIQKLLPLRIQVDDAALVIALTATEQLPIQAKLQRLARLRELQPDLGAREEVLRVPTTPKLLSMPAFDVALETTAVPQSPQLRHRYDVRIGADALYTGFQGYVGSDERGRPAAARLLFERRDPDGRLLGPVGASRLSLGDVYAPALAMGPRSIGGRGISISTAPIEQKSVFDRVDLRGELPIGYDVELYVNDVLRSGQQTPVQGRYEFLNVPLVRGVNIIRIVSYGPRGERSEETRVINVGGGALAKGDTAFEAGVVEQETPILDLGGADGDVAGPGAGKLRATVGIAHGLTEALTLVGGASLFSPRMGEERTLVTAGLRTSLLGYAAQLDAAYDDAGGKALGLGVAGSLFGVSTVLRHSEYRGGFVDEALPTGGSGEAMRRHSEANLDFNINPSTDMTIPLSVRFLRDEFADGRSSLIAGMRLSTSARGVLLSAGLDYDRVAAPRMPASSMIAGVLAASTYAGFKWQLRGTLDYELVPDLDIRAITVTADRSLSDWLALRLGAGRSFMGADNTSFQAGAVLRLPFGDLSVAGDFTVPNNDWRVGLQMAFGVVYDPLRQRFAVTRPGVAAGGNAAVQAFIDRNGDDRYEPAIDEPAPGVRVDSGGTQSVTDADGRLLVTGLGYGATARMQMNVDGIDNPYVSAPPSTIEFMPRAGDVRRIAYPLKPVGEVLARIQFRDAAGRLTGLSAVNVRAVRDDKPPVEGRTEFDGSVVFEHLEVGRYRLELDPVQAARLRMRLESPVQFTIAADGGFVPDVVALVVFSEPAN